MVKDHLNALKNLIKDSEYYKDLIDFEEGDDINILDNHIKFIKIEEEDIIYPHILLDYGSTKMESQSIRGPVLHSSTYFIVIEDLENNYENPLLDFTDLSVNLIDDVINKNDNLHILNMGLIEGPVESRWKNNNTIYIIFAVEVGF